MERNANYALVGLSTILLFIGLSVFAIWLARVAFGQQYDIYDVVFKGPVNGLSQGGEVHFNGIKVGEVRRIFLDPRDPTNVIARVQVDESVPIRTDSLATLEPMGITGINFVQISAGELRTTSTHQRRNCTQGQFCPLLKSVQRTTPYPVIASGPNVFGDLLAGGRTIAVRATESLDRINQLLSDDNIRTITATMNDIQTVTAELRARRSILADAQRAMQSADHAIQSADQAAQQIRSLAASSQTLVDGDGRRMATSLVAAAAEIQGTAHDVRGMVQQLNGPTSDFATTGLPQLQAAIVSLQQAADTLNRLAGDIQQNPQGLISRPPAAELQVQP